MKRSSNQISFYLHIHSEVHFIAVAKMENTTTVLALNPRPNSYLSLLDEKLLLNIFKRLDLFNQLQIGEIDVNYQRIIGEQIIMNQMLDVSKISKHYYTSHLFKQIGEYMTNLMIFESDIQYKDDKYTFIDEIFRLIEKRCIVGRLKSITIYLDKKMDQHTVTVVPKVFEEITSLTIHGYSVPFNNLLEKMISKCSNLCKLKLYSVNSNWNFLALQQLHMLQSLEIYNCQIPYTHWATLFDKSIHSQTHRLTNLMIKHSRFIIDVPDVMVVNLFKENFLMIMGIAFPALKDFAFIGRHDGKYLQKWWMFRNLEKMSINAYGMTISLSDINLLTNLRSIEFAEYTSIPVFEELLKLPLLSEFKLNKDEIDFDVITAIVAASRYLRVLLLNSWKPNIAWTFYNSLVIERATRWPDAQPLQMYARFKNFQRHKPNVIDIHRLN